MASYDEFKKKAKIALETITDVSVEAYKLAEEKAKLLAKRAKLNSEISHEKTLIRRLKLHLGNKYYELHKDDPAEDFKNLCDSITDSFERIDAKKKELDELKSGGTGCNCEDCDTDGGDAGESKDDADINS